VLDEAVISWTLCCTDHEAVISWTLWYGPALLPPPAPGSRHDRQQSQNRLRQKPAAYTQRTFTAHSLIIINLIIIIIISLFAQRS